jgi:hypothetical protein
MRSIEAVLDLARAAVQRHFPGRSIEKIEARRTEDADGDPLIFIYCQIDRYAPREDIEMYRGARDALVRALSDEEFPHLYVFDRAGALTPFAAA